MTPTTETETETETDVVEGELLPAVAEGGDLALQDTQAKAALAAFDSDDPWRNVPSGDLSPEPSRISHMALNRKVDGGFVDAETGEKSRELDLIWLAKGKSRAWWKDPYGKGEAAPGCRSFDGLKADPNSPDLQNAGDCTTCPHARWENGDPPACAESIESLNFVPDPGGIGRLTRIRWGGLSVAPARAYWNSFEERLPKRPPMAYVTHVELTETETDNGTFLVPRFSRGAELPYTEAEPLIAERDRRIAEWQEDLARDVTEGRVEGPGDKGDPFADEPIVADGAPPPSEPDDDF